MKRPARAARRGLPHQALAARAAELERGLDERPGFERLAGHSRAIARVVGQLRHVASTRATVLIEGEPGTGKALAARALHHSGPRAGGPFVWLDLGTLAEARIEAELFGEEPGAAGEELRRGSFEIADGGTLHLAEIGAAPPAVQVRLLRAIQDRSFERAGGTETLRSDVRLIATTSTDLAAEVEAGRFRDDLFVRLAGVRVRMPPLRERPEDIPLLVESFIGGFNRRHRRRVTGVTRGVLERLAGHPWPGNVRQLENAIESMVLSAHGRRPLDLSDLPEWLRGAGGEAPRLEIVPGMTMEEVERRIIAATLEHTGHDKRRAAAMLGIGLRTLYRKMERHGID